MNLRQPTLTWTRIASTAGVYALVWPTLTVARALIERQDIAVAIIESIPTWLAVVATVVAVGWTWRDRDLRAANDEAAE